MLGCKTRTDVAGKPVLTGWWGGMRVVFALSIAFLVAALVAPLSSTPAQALKWIEVGRDTDRTDIAPFATLHEGIGDSLQIETAPGTDGLTDRVVVPATTPKTSPTWIAFALRNVSDTRVERWLAADRYSLFGAGIIWPRLDQKQIEAVTPSVGFLPELLPFDGTDVYRLTIEPGQTVTFVVEMTSDHVPRLSIWRPLDFEKRSRNKQLFNGIMLGITGLLAVFLSAVFAANHKIIFPSAALFTWCVFAYLCVDFGFWHKLFNLRPTENAQYRAATEAAVAATWLVFVHTFLRLGSWHGFAQVLMRIWILGQLALVGISFLDPKLAATFARASLGGMFVILSIFVIWLALRGQDRAQSLVPTWVLFGVWLAGMTLVLTGRIPHEAMSTALVSGLVLIVLLVGFTVTQYAFRSQDPVHALNTSDQHVRLLALDNAGVAVWEWSAKRDEIKVSEAMEVALGLSTGELHTSAAAFLQRIHPVDRDRLQQALEHIRQTGDGEIRLDFRMRHADNDYRWFELEAAPDPTIERRRLRCVGLVREITDRRLASDRLTFDTVHDGVTGLPNRALFIDRLKGAVERAGIEPLVIPTVFVIDIDRFKTITATVGAIEADGLLIAVARRLQHLVGPGETLARIGSDQFGLLLVTQRSERELQMFAEMLRAAVRAVVRVGTVDITPTAAIGYATFERRKGALATDTLDEAEIAMHRAKRLGRDQVMAFLPDMRSDRDEKVQIESDLIAAIDANKLIVHYQPVYAIRARQLVGFEALVRWKHPRLGMLNPVDFVPLAEESELIVKLGASVLAIAVADLQRWHKTYDKPGAPLWVSVNISRRQLMSPGLVTQVRTVLNSASLPKGTVRLEVTESLVMENPERAAEALEDLAAAGIGLSLDDFGAGYSSLTYLNTFPFDCVKVDRALVHGASQTGPVASILRSIVSLAHELGKTVIAEGVETEEDLAVLKALGCEFAQGFLFDAALDQRQVLALLKDARKEDRKLRRGGLMRLRRHKAPASLAEESGQDAMAPPAPQPKTRPVQGSTSRPDAPQPRKVAPLKGTQSGRKPNGGPPSAPDAHANGATERRARPARATNGAVPQTPNSPPPVPAAAMPAPDEAMSRVQASLEALTREMVQPAPGQRVRGAPPPMPAAEQPAPPVYQPVPHAVPPPPPLGPGSSPRMDLTTLPPEIAASLAKLAGRPVEPALPQADPGPPTEKPTA